MSIFQYRITRDIKQSSRLNNDATYGMSCEYMTFPNLYIVCRVDISLTQSFKINSYFLFVTLVQCTGAPGGMIFDKHDKSRRYLTLMTVKNDHVLYTN